MRKGAFTSMILVEVAWLGVCSPLSYKVLRLNISLGLARLALDLVPLHGCDSIPNSRPQLWTQLQEPQCFSIVLANRGYDRVWYQSVKETEFNAPPVNVAPQAIPTQQYIAPQNSGAYPPQATPVSGWAGTPQQAPVPVAYPQQA
ncbi:hypothetical protein H0H87_004216 [Tephrocybe sp. NHM501043]|nr:hypothetical protein H0H87_004216 [Tephrocybe sp. NHM501043]